MYGLSEPTGRRPRRASHRMSGPSVEPEVLRSISPSERPRVSALTAVRTEPLGGGPLTAAALAGTTPPGWYPPRPRGARDWRERAAATRARHDGATWLDELWPAILPTGAARERLQRAATHGVVVTSGQQPGLFGGPIYTWSKAIGVLALADALERLCGVPVAPLFWAATDDADFVEASTTWISVSGGAVPITSEPLARNGIVLAQAAMGDLSAPLGQLLGAAGSAPFGAAIDAVQAAYRPQGGSRGEEWDGSHAVTAGNAFVALLRRLLAPLGVSVLDAAHDAARRRAFPTLRRALQEADVVTMALDQRSEAITAAGFTPQVSNVPKLSLVFSWHDEPGSDASTTGATKARVPVAQARELAATAQP